MYCGPPRAVRKMDAEGTHNSHKGTSSVKKNEKSNEYDMKQLRVLRRALEYLDEHGTSVQAYSLSILVLLLTCCPTRIACSSFLLMFRQNQHDRYNDTYIFCCIQLNLHMLLLFLSAWPKVQKLNGQGGL